MDESHQVWNFMHSDKFINVEDIPLLRHAILENFAILENRCNYLICKKYLRGGSTEFIEDILMSNLSWFWLKKHLLKIILKNNSRLDSKEKKRFFQLLDSLEKKRNYFAHAELTKKEEGHYIENKKVKNFTINLAQEKREFRKIWYELDDLLNKSKYWE